MKVLTPTGYKDPSTLANGDALCAFDLTVGTPIVNHVENIDFVDYAEWCRWWQVEDAVPPFTWYLINGEYRLFREQLIWRNDGVSYTHARELVVGDVIYDDQDCLVTITSIVEEPEDRSGVWYRFDVSGDHSYILDGLTVHNASISWQAGPGSWTPSNTANWVGGVVPGSGDAVTFPVGSGNCTLNFGGTITVQSITATAYNATWDNSVNNNNISLSNSTVNAFSISGTATRSMKMGTATYTFTGANAGWNAQTVSGLTFTGTPNFTFTGTTSGNKTFAGGGLTYGALSLSACSASAFWSITGANTFGSVTIPAPNFIQFAGLTTNTVSGAVNITGGPTTWVTFCSSVVSSSAGFSVGASSSFVWCSFRDITFTGSPTARDCVDLGNNNNVTINPPAGLAPPPMVFSRGTPY